MATLRSPSGSIIQATGRLEQRLLAAGWTATDQPPTPGLRLVTASELDQLAATLETARTASQADRTDLREIVEPIAVEVPAIAAEVDQLTLTVEATTTALAPKPTPRTDALEAWRTQAEAAIDTIMATVTAIDVPAAVSAYMAANPPPALHPVATSGSYTDLVNKPTLGTMAAQGKSVVDITGGTITGITDLAVGDGGTGASTPANARTNLGLGGAATLDVGTTAGTVAAGNDARLSDARTPTAHTHPAAQVTGLATVATTGAYADLTGKPALTFDPAGSAAAAQAAAIQRANHTGTQSADTLTDGTTNKAFLATERTKLTGIATAATANDTDANLKARANHTGTQPVTTITGLHAVATSGAYTDLTGRPTLATVATTGSYTDLSNKPAAPTVVRLTADHAPFTTTSLVNVTGLSFPVVAGTYYAFRFDVIFRTPALTTGAGFGLTIPAATVYTATVTIPFAADGAAANWIGFLTSSGDSVLSTGVQAINTDHLATIEGVILPSANGTVQLQAKTEVAASNLTVRNGSQLTY